MNIIEAYIKFKDQLIILISGLSGSGKTYVAKNINNDFKLQCMSLESYCKKKYNKKVKISDKLTVVDWDDLDSYNWEKFNKDVEFNKRGVIVTGTAFPRDRIYFQPDVHINITTSKGQVIENRRKFIKTHPSLCNDMKKILYTHDEIDYINKVVYPHYVNDIKKSNVNKFFKGTLEEIVDNVFNFIIEKIQKYVNDYNEKIMKRKIKYKLYDDTGFLTLDNNIEIYDVDDEYVKSNDIKYNIKNVENKFIGVS